MLQKKNVVISKKKHFQADILLPLFDFEYKETINVLITFQMQ